MQIAWMTPDDGHKIIGTLNATGAEVAAAQRRQERFERSSRLVPRRWPAAQLQSDLGLLKRCLETWLRAGPSEDEVGVVLQHHLHSVFPIVSTGPVAFRAAIVLAELASRRRGRPAARLA